MLSFMIALALILIGAYYLSEPGYDRILIEDATNKLDDPMKKQNIEALINLVARRAIILPAFSIYGDIGGFYDYGPIGTRIRNNIIALWRSTFIEGMGNLEVDTTIVAPPLSSRRAAT